MERKSNLENILKVAEESFAKSGYRGVSLQEIAETAGISKSLIFYYFKDKKELYEELIKKSVDLVLIKLKEAISSRKSPTEKIEEFVKNFFELLLNEEHLIQLLARETSNPESETATFVIRKSQKIIEILASIIEEGIKEGVFRNVSPRLSAISLFGMLTTYVAARNIFSRQIPPGELKTFSAQELSKINTEIFLKGITKC